MRHCFVLFLLSLLPLLSSAQDLYFSQFYASRVYLNPAYAGFDPGTTVELNYRDQWFGVPDGDVSTFNDSYRTFIASADFQFPCLFELNGLNFGLGVSALRDEAGNNPLITQGLGIANSFEIRLSEKKNVKRDKRGYPISSRMDLRLGYQVNAIYKTLQGNHFIYSSQLDPVAGLIDPASSLSMNSPFFLNINTGIMLRGYRGRTRSFGDLLYTFGVSISNISQPNESLRGETGTFSLYRRYTFHAGATLPFQRYVRSSSSLNIAPQVRFDTQAKGELNMLTLGFYLLSKGFYLGGFYQGNTKFYKAPEYYNTLSGNFLTKNTSNLILLAGIDLKSIRGKRKKNIHSNMQQWVIGLSYDIGLSGLSSDNTIGVMELHLRMNFGRRDRQRCGFQPGKFELYDGSCPVRF